MIRDSMDSCDGCVELQAKLEVAEAEVRTMFAAGAAYRAELDKEISRERAAHAETKRLAEAIIFAVDSSPTASVQRQRGPKGPPETAKRLSMEYYRAVGSYRALTAGK